MNKFEAPISKESNIEKSRPAEAILDPETGKEIFKLKEILEQNLSFMKEKGLFTKRNGEFSIGGIDDKLHPFSEAQKKLEEIFSSPAQIRLIQEKYKRGFDKMLIIPFALGASTIWEKLVEENKDLDMGGKDRGDICTKRGRLGFVSDPENKKDELDEIEMLNNIDPSGDMSSLRKTVYLRHNPGQAFRIILVKNTKELHENAEDKRTLDRPAIDLFHDMREDSTEGGLTFEDYLYWFAIYLFENKTRIKGYEDFPDSFKETWLLGSRPTVSRFRILNITWDSSQRAVHINAIQPDKLHARGFKKRGTRHCVLLSPTT